MRLGLLGNQGAALSAFQQAPLLSFHCFAQPPALAPGPGGRASSATGLVPAKRLLLPQPVLSQESRAGLQNHADKSSRLQRVGISGGQRGDPQGKIPGHFPGLSVTVLISFPAGGGGTPHRSHLNENPTPDILEEGGPAFGSFESSWLSVSQGSRKIILYIWSQRGPVEERVQKLEPPGCLLWKLLDLSIN